MPSRTHTPKVRAIKRVGSWGLGPAPKKGMDMKRALAFFSLTLTALIAACGGDGPLSKAKGEIGLSQQALDFGSVLRGGSQNLSVAVSNLGNARLEICTRTDPSIGCETASGVVANNTAFSAGFSGADPTTGLWSVALGGNGQRAPSFSVVFTPPDAGLFAGKMELVGAEGASASITLSGTGVAPDVEAQPALLEWGRVVAGTSAQKTVILKNGVSFPQPIEIPAQPGVPFVLSFGEGELSQAMWLDQPLRFTLPPQSTTTLNVWYAPVDLSEFEGSLEVVPCAGCAPTSVSLHGIGAPRINEAGNGGDPTTKQNTHTGPHPTS
jgi:hypothetical protein